MKKLEIIIIIGLILLGIFIAISTILVYLVDINVKEMDNKLLSKYQIGESRNTILKNMDHNMVYKEVKGPRQINKEKLLPGYYHPQRPLYDNEYVLILYNGVYLYFDSNNILIHKEKVGS
jgi:hypothetical protein